MAARAAWLLLWPLLTAVVLFGQLLQFGACGDDGAADQGSEVAGRYCDLVYRWGYETGDRLLTTLLAVPLLVLGAGFYFWSRPAALRWVSGLAFVMAGILLVSLGIASDSVDFAVTVAFAWGTALFVAALVAARPRRSR